MRTLETVTVSYDDRTARGFVWATIVWGVIGMLVGVMIALELAHWPANLGLPWLTFGRLRPVHTNAVVFAFAGNAFFAGVYYAMQRLLKTRMWSDKLSTFHLWGWQLIILAAAITIPLGFTQGKEYAETEWPIDLAITVVWVAFMINVFGTLAIRRVKHLYVALWFFLASILAIAMLHLVNNAAIPVTFWKSYPIYAGVQDALVEWWYGHNAVGFILTTPFLGLMYYFVPKAAERPVYSYRLSIIHFWGLVFIYIWAGPHHLLYTALPEWAQSLGMVFSIMLLAPSWGGMINGLLTLRGAWDRVRTDPVLKFFVLSITFYGMATLEGPIMSIKSVNLITHYTDWTIAHVHGGALGWVGGMTFGMIYFLAPRLWNTNLYSTRLANAHFWVSTVGIVLYITTMWAAGLTEGLMWFAKDPSGMLKYPNFIEIVLAVKPLYWGRFIGGTLYLTGALLCLYNVYMTARAAGDLADEQASVTVERVVPLGETWHERIERHGLTMTILVILVMAIGGMVEIVPTFLIANNVPTIAAVKPYTPLELVGRDIYVREGCYNCHSQMIRRVAEETMRYGPYSRAGEFVYDHPFQWGSKRIGPDLQRVGGKYPDIWHYRHMLDPRSTSPGSIMPPYRWLKDHALDLSDLPAKMQAMKKLGVPYGDAEMKEPVRLALAQAASIAKGLRDSGAEIADDRELLAVIGYLQRLGVDYKKSLTPAVAEDQASDKASKQAVAKDVGSTSTQAADGAD